MRAIRVYSSYSLATAGLVNYYGPLEDLSGVDTSQVASVSQLLPWDDLPGHLTVAHLSAPHLSGVTHAGHLDTPWLAQPWLDAIQRVEMADPRAYEYGVIPLKIQGEDARGNQSAMLVGAILVNSAPQPAAQSTLDQNAGQLRMTIEEWPTYG